MLISSLCLMGLFAAGPAASAQEQEKDAAKFAPVPDGQPNMMMHRGMMGGQGMQGQGMMPGMQGQGMMPGQGMQGPGMRGPGMMGRRMQGQGMMPGRQGMPGKNRRMMPGPEQRRPGMMGLTSPESRMLRKLRNPEVQKEIGLTADQKKKLEDLRFGAGRDAIQTRANLQVQQLELGRLMRQETPDRAAIDKKIDEITQAESALRKSMVHGQMDAQNVLTREQKQKLSDLAAPRNRQAGPGGAAVPQPKAKPAGAKPAASAAPKAPAA